MNDLRQKVSSSKMAFLKTASIEAQQRSNALKRIADELIAKTPQILAANEKDLEATKPLVEKGEISEALFKRLKLSESKIRDMAVGVQSVEELANPVGKTLSCLELDRGLELFQITVPIGVICTIFESRPDALIQISSLCIKSANAVILKGGTEAQNSNQILATIVRDALRENNLPVDLVQLIETREDVKNILTMDDLIDLIVPRGSNEFVSFIQKNTNIPVLGHASGICHEYVAQDADLNKAYSICFDAKVQYPAVCNAMETLLVDEAISEQFLPEMAKKYLDAGVELRGDQRVVAVLQAHDIDIKEASEEDWTYEYNDLILSIKIVGDMNEAIDFINRCGSAHTDGIITENKEKALAFITRVDSSSVVWNASTRFSDGYRYGKGAEVGIATGKIHTRGPAGIDSLLTYKYVLVGDGHVVANYSGNDARKFTHRKLEKSW
ncbi:glutamate-5-semialdehyde dehydrogenase [Candidatus Uabimicrobium amorphum]|uniref:Gamma-glutamyl phosphate reductase n=1 Tax=Uabimicrobium amorphum TaxID=2596890 RepID=A0A5S9F4U5_UABAM|nr:glutamate-5-semialdehyde dehydrogenase [Candidatus Uabimicrobium amorphum]BBM85922.1 gamma-glutamyl phosphate reductase [Candidatus Uabimicrobium amorphum]